MLWHFDSDLYLHHLSSMIISVKIVIKPPKLGQNWCFNSRLLFLYFVILGDWHLTPRASMMSVRLSTSHWALHYQSLTFKLWPELWRPTFSASMKMFAQWPTSWWASHNRTLSFHLWPHPFIVIQSKWQIFFTASISVRLSTCQRTLHY